MFEGTIVAARLLQFWSAMVLFGSPLFFLYGFKGGAAESPPRWYWAHIILLIAAIGALLGVIAWVVAQTAVMFADSGGFDFGAFWTVLTGTGFGRAAFLRLGLIVAALLGLLFLAPGRLSWIAQTILGGLVVASFARTGHGMMDEGAPGTLHFGGDLLHLLSAAIWIGALVPLGVLIMRSLRTQSEADARLAYHALERFSGIGPAVVAVLVLSGLINSWFLIGPNHLGALFTTLYGQLLTAKLILFAAMLALAAANRVRLSPTLGLALQQHVPSDVSLRVLQLSVLMETVFAVLVILVVSWMGTLEPPGT